MATMNFTQSQPLTIGIELELQIINPNGFDLIGRARELLRQLRYIQKHNTAAWAIKPEITLSMVEINSSPHQNTTDLLNELSVIRELLCTHAEQLGVRIAGGGTHPFQKWRDRKISPAQRFKKLSQQYGYLAQRFTVFGQHIHIGCANGDDAVYLTHALARYIPHFIALSASSPFYQGIDSHFDSARANIVNAFPLSGVIPFITSWDEFDAYFNKMQNLGIVQTIKDFYWDIRPKPEYGTVEIRICDTPLTIHKAARLAAYAQTLASYLLSERNISLTPDIYLAYNYNRFQASRYGLQGHIIDGTSEKSRIIKTDLLATIAKLSEHAIALNNEEHIEIIRREVLNNHNDAIWLRETAANSSLPILVEQQTQLWQQDIPSTIDLLHA